MAAMQGEPPAVARRRVRFALRRYRAATGMNQLEVAKHLRWSMSKIQRIESGEVAVSVTDLRALLDLFRVEDAEVIAKLVEDAEISRRQRWYEKPEYRAHLTKGLRQLLQFEPEAAKVRVFQQVIVPGFLQTPAYAESILAWWNLSEDERRVRFDVRMLRKQQILNRAEGPECFVIMDESALIRRVGSAEIMAEQLASLMEVSLLPRMHIRVVPLDQGAHESMLGPFQLLDFADGDDDDAVLYRESYDQDSITHASEELAFHRIAFDSLWANCRDERDTRDVLQKNALEFRLLR